MLLNKRLHLQLGPAPRQFDPDREQVLAALPGQGVELVVNPGCDLEKQWNTPRTSGNSRTTSMESPWASRSWTITGRLSSLMVDDAIPAGAKLC